MKRKFRIKRNAEYTPHEKRLNVFSSGLIFVSGILFVTLDCLNKDHGILRMRDLAGILAFSSLILTIGFAISLQIEPYKRFLFSFTILLFSIFSQFESVMANIIIFAAIIFTALAISMLFAFGRDIFSKKIK